MKTSSCKAKGRNLQNHVADVLRTRFPNLDPSLIKPAIMGEKGVDIKLFGEAANLINLSIECKNVEKLNVWAAWDQTLANAVSTQIPALIMKKNRTKALIVMDFETFVAWYL